MPHLDLGARTLGLGGPLRVAWVVTPLSPYGGTITHLSRWAESLALAGVRLELLYHSPEEDRGTLLPLPSSLMRKRIPGLDLRSRDPRRAVAELKQCLKAGLPEGPFQLVHTLYPVSDVLGGLAARACGLPVMSSVEGRLLVSHLSWLTKRGLGWAWRRQSAHLRALTAVSSVTGTELGPHLHPKAPRVMTLYPGVPPAPTADRTFASPFRLLAVGRFAPVKDFETLLEAMRLLKDRGLEAGLTLVGAGPEAEELQAASASKGLQGKVVFTGWLSQPEVETQLDSAHILVIPSRHEGLPWVALEAMSRGLPVVASRVGGLPELVVTWPEQERTGYLFSPGRPDSLAAVLEECLARPEGLQSVSRRARARVQAHFSQAEEGLRLLSLYRRVAEAGRGRRA